MSESFRPKFEIVPNPKVDPKYLGWAQNSILRPIALDMTRDALTQSWEQGKVDPMEMRLRQNKAHTALEESYEEARIRCENGDTNSCEIQQDTELVLGSILQTGDIFSEGAISQHVEKIAPSTGGPKIRILAYDDED